MNAESLAQLEMLPPTPPKIPISRMEGDIGKRGGGGSVTPVRGGGNEPVGPSVQELMSRLVG